MEITKEILETIRNRVNQYCHVKYKEEPCEIKIKEDDTIEVVYHKYARGSYTDEYEIKVSELTRDLDEVHAERKEAEVKAEKARQAERKKDREARELRELEQRRRKYNELKKEFG